MKCFAGNQAQFAGNATGSRSDEFIRSREGDKRAMRRFSTLVWTLVRIRLAGKQAGVGAGNAERCLPEHVVDGDDVLFVDILGVADDGSTRL